MFIHAREQPEYDPGVCMAFRTIISELNRNYFLPQKNFIIGIQTLRSKAHSLILNTSYLASATMQRISDGWFTRTKTIVNPTRFSIEVEEVLADEKTQHQEVMVLQTATMQRISEGWFTQTNTIVNPTQFSIEVEEVLADEKTQHQEVMVLQTKKFGKALLLDGTIQCTERDEFALQEMITFLPLCAHPDPASVLVVGNGDGGVIRELNKHPSVKEIIQVQIDQRLVDICKEHLPSMAVGFQSPKLELKICNGFQYIEDKCHSKFDVIISDSKDIIGHAVNLYGEDYLTLLKDALKPSGIVCIRGGTYWYQMGSVRQVFEACQILFGTVKYAWTNVPTCPSGQVGLIVAAVENNTTFDTPCRIFTSEEENKMNLKYYNAEVHKAAFALPNFVKRKLYR